MKGIGNRRTIDIHNYGFANTIKKNAAKHYLFTKYQIFNTNYIIDFSIDVEQKPIDVEQYPIDVEQYPIDMEQ